MQKHSKTLDGILKYLVAAVFMVVPLYPKFPFINVPGTFVSIRIEDFLLALIALILAILVFPNIKRFAKNDIHRAIFLYLVVGLTSFVSATLVTKTVTPHIGLLHWVRRVEYFVPFFLGVMVLKRKEDLEFYLKVLMVSLTLMFFYGFGQKNDGWPIIVTQNQEYARGVALYYVPGGHINSTFAGHYDLSTFLVMLLPIYLSLFLTLFFTKKNYYTKLTLFMVISFGLWLIAFSGSRISVVSYLLSATGTMILIRKYKAIPLVVAYSLLIFSFSPSLVARYSRIIEVTTAKLKGINRVFMDKTSKAPGLVFAKEEIIAFPERREQPEPTPTPLPVFEDRSTSIRLNVEWPRAIRALSKNPLLGTGYSSITLATDNDYLRLLGEVGILGFFAFFLILFRLAKLILRAFPLNKNYQGIELAFVAGVIGGLPGVFLNAVFIDVFEASKFAITFWLIIGIFVTTVKKYKYE